MLARSLVLLLLLAPLAAADTSRRSRRISFADFDLVRSFRAMPASIVSADGRFLAAYTGNSAVLFDLRTGERVRELTGHAAGIHDGYFSDDGSRVVTAGYDGTTRVYETETGREIRNFGGHSGYA